MSDGAPDISVVIACHEMARELPRTLRSLAPPYQHPAGRLEVIVVDNGSAAPPCAEDFAALGLDLRVRAVPAPTASPVAAINLGLAQARGAMVGVWIDGARLASPGLLAACAAAARLHPRPVVATLNYQLGPTRQYEASRTGYDQAAEDALLAGIAWPEDGYRLFAIATPELAAGPTAPMLESNALFLPRALWDELGGYDPDFAEPGGGVANPDAFIRACALPGAQLIRILGEGTFHQFHGGLSTSTPERAIEVLRQGSRAYLRRRGKPLAPVRQPGWLFDSRRGALVETAPA
jgi:hypothetical protein